MTTGSGASRSRQSSANGIPAYNAPRGAFTGKGKQKRDVVSTTGQSRRRSSRSRNQTLSISLPPGTTGTAEQSS